MTQKPRNQLDSSFEVALTWPALAPIVYRIEVRKKRAALLPPLVAKAARAGLEIHTAHAAHAAATHAARHAAAA
ncbi:hypothetical protein, partial [Mesorhizobium sp.]|uniref:hypothetical protein n=1 Tax=Mesorhizobium sp. TaxID=1871066 RepID=UPI00257B451C